MASSFKNRTTSAPNRMAEQMSSQYHTKCVANPNALPHKRVKSAEPTNSLESYDQSQKHCLVTQDEIWKSSCDKEKIQQTKWEKHWGFLTHYDQKGNPKEPKHFRSDANSPYSETVPNTSNGHYGLRSRSRNTNYIQRLERSGHNLRKNKELLYYD
ncbi:uncharacterized protein LOC114527513 [Dendronephthya gigantea]|uniref:uncharacterized protein LOC114527513 n=1 Tax=Dendronephthya gigantea TaxID=151771 RepID=UPI001069B3A6|nr:uncharacterized protein LOC114527513 [Dendronephthya gigantea]